MCDFLKILNIREMRILELCALQDQSTLCLTVPRGTDQIYIRPSGSFCRGPTARTSLPDNLHDQSCMQWQ